jgi:hypothetical protein
MLESERVMYSNTIYIAADVYVSDVPRWEVFRKNLEDMRRHSDFKGLQHRKRIPVKKWQYFTANPKASIYTFPAPDCMCEEKISNAANADTLSSQT